MFDSPTVIQARLTVALLTQASPASFAAVLATVLSATVPRATSMGASLVRADGQKMIFCAANALPSQSPPVKGN
ncbi:MULTISPECIES: hypothetical protein [Pseudomonas]|uniref:hypothetical protein n=1 Tax=Pseudomonas TaxID=286 RepID=UPI001041EB56|nr:MULTISPECIES: hypothetical protein [Pseudomonas]